MGGWAKIYTCEASSVTRVLDGHRVDDLPLCRHEMPVSSWPDCPMSGSLGYGDGSGTGWFAWTLCLSSLHVR